jgi:uncharacterized protein (DUF983 family)
MLHGILKNLCPRCGKTHVFHNLVMMQKSCTHCQYIYEKQNGYFLGAMVVGYILGAFSTVPTIVIGVMVLQAPLFAVIATACVQILVLTPVLFRFSRLIWIYTDYRSDPHTRSGENDPSPNQR